MKGPSSGTSRKILPKWKGPFQVTKVPDGDRYEVKEIRGMQRCHKPYTGIVGVENMKRCIHFLDFALLYTVRTEVIHAP